MSVIIVPASQTTTVTRIEADGSEVETDALVDDAGKTITFVGPAETGLGNKEPEGASNRRAAFSHGFSDDALATVKKKIAAAEERDSLPGDWRPEPSR